MQNVLERVAAIAERERAKQGSARERLRLDHPELVDVIETWAGALWAVPAKVTCKVKASGKFGSVGKSLPERVTKPMPQGLTLGNMKAYCDERFEKAIDDFNASFVKRTT